MLEDAADDLEFELRKDYSGRGMYGKKCIGIVTGQTGFQIALKLGEFSRDYLSRLGYEELIDEMTRNCFQDSMGIETIFYFPRIQWGKENQED